MSPRLRYTLFGLLCLAQLAVPVSLVVKHEDTRRNGSAWRFQTAPVDPADPFRGRYVRLAFAAERSAVPMANSGLLYLREGSRLYAELAPDANGYAQMVRLHQQRPLTGEYLDVFLRHMNFKEGADRNAPPAAFVRLPFDRYYLPEAQAPEVERAYNEASRKAQANTWVEVRVLEGHPALVGLVLDGKPVGL